MIRAFSAQMVLGGHEPRPLAWDGMKQAVGLKGAPPAGLNRERAGVRCGIGGRA
jgi:hypothetical protein